MFMIKQSRPNVKYILNGSGRLERTSDAAVFRTGITDMRR